MKIKEFLKNHLGLFVIIALAIFLRFVNYFDRIIVSQDQGRDAIIALESIRSRHLPQLGPPSSAWGFNFGPLYYYIVILFSLIPVNFAPWIGFTCLSVLSIFLLYKTGESIINKRFGYLLGFVGAISFAEISNSVNLLNTSLVSFAVCASVFSLQKLLSSKKAIYGVLLGFFVGLAINAHMQALSLLSLLPLSIIFLSSKKRTIQTILSEIFGILLSFVPLLLFETKTNFAWSKSVLDYSLHVGDKFYVPIRWLTEITQFWPKIFGNVLTGQPQVGYFIVSLIAFAVIWIILRRKSFPKLITVSLIALVIEVLSVRYYKGPRSVEYFVVVQPLVILFFSWSVWQMFSINKFLGAALLLAFSFITLKSDIRLIQTPTHAPELRSLYQSLPNSQKINLYTFPDSSELNFSLFYLLLRNGQIGEGRDIAICDNHESPADQAICPADNVLSKSGRFVLYDISGKSGNVEKEKLEKMEAQKILKNLYINYQSIK